VSELLNTYQPPDGWIISNELEEEELEGSSYDIIVEVWQQLPGGNEKYHKKPK